MPKTTIVSMIGLALLLTVLLGCSTLGLAVREGLVQELLIRFPPDTRYQLILRIGSDAVPWDRSTGRPMAINLWAHGRGTDWHIVSLVHVPLGHKETCVDC